MHALSQRGGARGVREAGALGPRPCDAEGFVRSAGEVGPVQGVEGGSGGAEGRGEEGALASEGLERSRPVCVVGKRTRPGGRRGSARAEAATAGEHGIKSVSDYISKMIRGSLPCPPIKMKAHHTTPAAVGVVVDLELPAENDMSILACVDDMRQHGCNCYCIPQHQWCGLTDICMSFLFLPLLLALSPVAISLNLALSILSLVLSLPLTCTDVGGRCRKWSRRRFVSAGLCVSALLPLCTFFLCNSSEIDDNTRAQFSCQIGRVLFCWSFGMVGSLEWDYD